MSIAPSTNKTVVVGLSGGVDSSVSALLLKEQGYNVIGLFMKNWEEADPEKGTCTSAQDFEDVKRVCDSLQIPYYAIEFVEEYRKQVFEDFLAEYKAGYTPNPDILCNREIKFKLFYDKALSLGADYLATGHYCNTTTRNGEVFLSRGLDTGKDQSYFLAMINGDTLKKTLFPIGHLQKKEVRALAEKAGLPVATKKDSTGICFIGERSFRPFLKQYLAAQPGEIRLIDTEEKVGTHQGSAYYTLGQRKGLGLGGEGEPWFVVKKDTAKNILYVARGDDHPALYSDSLTAEQPSWINKNLRPSFPLKCTAKSRYRQTDQECTVHMSDDGLLNVEFSEPQRALTPGQYVVFYQGEVCLGGARIRSVAPSYYERGLKIAQKIMDTTAPLSP